jgi:membrane protein required for colicin V production
MQGIDIFFLVLFGILVLRCFLHGFTGEIISLASIALGLAGAVFFFKNGAAFIRTFAFATIKVIPEILAFLGIFLIVYILGRIIDHIVKDIINRLNLTGLNRFLGFILGLIEGVAAVSLILLLLCIQPLFDSTALLEKSIFARVLLPFIGMAREWVWERNV